MQNMQKKLIFGAVYVKLVGLSMICYTEAQKIIESSFGRIPVKRAHGKVIVFAKMNRKLRLKVAE